MEDRVLFEQAYAFHGKNFRKVQQLVRRPRLYSSAEQFFEHLKLLDHSLNALLRCFEVASTSRFFF